MKSWFKNKWNKGKILGEDHMVEYMQTGYAGDESTLIPTGRVFDAKQTIVSVNMEKYENETIAAIATALSDSGIGIVRISGENAIYIICLLYTSPSPRD